MSLPFAFEPRPVDQIMPGRRAAYDTATCWNCRKPVNYAEWSDIDQVEYRISFMCPECIEDALADNERTGCSSF
jgi:hypothetical protein